MGTLLENMPGDRWAGIWVSRVPTDKDSPEAAPGLPLRTRAAATVWAKMREIAGNTAPKALTAAQLVQQAIAEADIRVYEMTREDVHLLALAAQWLLADENPSMPPRIPAWSSGGSPSPGPMNSLGYGHEMAPRR